MTITGTPVVDALETFYRRDIDDLARWVRRTLDDSVSRDADVNEILAALRADEFLAVYLEQIHSVPPERWARSLPLAEGRLRAALLGRELIDVPRSGRLNLIMDGQHYGAERLPGQLSADYRELKGPLCYAHDVVLEDPFDDEHHALRIIETIRETFPQVQARPAPHPDLFVRTVEALADLAPLVRAGIVTFLPRQLTADPRSIEVAGSSLAGAGGEISRRELAERTLRAWLLTGGRAVPLFASEDEESAFNDAAGVLSALTPAAESTALRHLAALAVPASGRLEIRRMLEIRHEDAFAHFRVRQRKALLAVGDGLDSDARRIYREEMRAAAEEVNRRTGRGLLAKFTVPKAMGWLTGAMVVHPDGWKAALGALGALSTEAVLEAWQDRDARAHRALHHHYATLAGPPRD
nr:hypothetical protein [uncultured Actinoplanes sp.]